ncbi:MAG: AraC family transcriptional regulator [Spirochaetes bacterium]|nr:AraC family transcriptional regulator [Spirochaetota bacterium]
MAVALFVRPISLRSLTLAIVLVAFAAIQLSSVLFYTRLIYNFPHLIYYTPLIGALIPPCLYFYAQTFTCGRTGLAVRDWPHFVPFLIILLFIFPRILLPVETKLSHIDGVYNSFSPFSSLIIFNMLYFTIYFILIIINIKRVYLKESIIHKRLLKVFVFLLSLIALTIIKVLGMVFTSLTEISLNYSELATIIFSVYLFYFFFLSQRYPFLLAYGSMAPCCIHGDHGDVSVKVEAGRKRSKSYLDSVDIDHTVRELTLLMQEEKLFCDEDLSLKRLSRAMNITPHQLSSFLNEYFNKNFNTYINEYRIKYACELLSDSTVSTLSVAFASGFNSYSAFFSSFKKVTGQSPGDFKNSLRDQRSVS